MKKLLLFICSLLPILCIIIPSPVLADSKTLPTGDSYEQIGQKIDDFYKKDALQMARYSIHQTIYKPMNRNFYVEFLSLTLSLIAQYSY